MNNEAKLLEAIQMVGAKCIRLEARCDALDVVLCALAQRQGIPLEKIGRAIDTAQAERHQARLECLEDSDPAGAAALDCRARASELLD